MKNYLIIMILFFSLKLAAQEQDFQTWQSIGVSYGITEKLKASFSNESRFRENSSIMDRNQIDLGIDYRIKDNITAGIYYRYVADDPFNDCFATYNRFYGDFSYELKPKRIEVVGRLRIATDAEDSEALSDAFNNWIHREKLTLRYNIKKTSFTPYIACEAFFPIRSFDHYLQKYRLFAGFTYKLNKANRVGASFMRQHRFGEKTQSVQNVFMIDYSIRIN